MQIAALVVTANGQGLVGSDDTASGVLNGVLTFFVLDPDILGIHVGVCPWSSPPSSVPHPQIHTLGIQSHLSSPFHSSSAFLFSNPFPLILQPFLSSLSITTLSPSTILLLPPHFLFYINHPFHLFNLIIKQQQQQPQCTHE